MSYLTNILTSKVYDVAIESPLQLAPKLSQRLGVKVWLKRNDLQPILKLNMMATKTKDIGTSNNIGKREKVTATTTSNSHTKASPSNKATTTSSSTSLKPSSASTPTEKPLPNYLKPTKSSLQDSAAACPKPTLSRRRSFDNKALPSRAQKPQAQQPARSSSSSTRGAGGVRPPSQPLYTKAAKKGSGEAFVRKGSPSAVAVAVDDRGDDQVVKKVEDHDHHDEAKEPQDIATVSEELVANPDGDGDDHDHISNVGVEEEHNKVLESGEVGEEESHNDNDNGVNGKDIVGSEEAIIGVVEELVKVEEETSEGHLEIINDGDTNAKESREDDIGDVDEDNNDVGVENEDESGKKSEEAKSPPASSTTENKGQGSGKKEAQIAYNDVIEETATKLLEKRKNKVKALVGAFETVIDYESAAK